MTSLETGSVSSTTAIWSDAFHVTVWIVKFIEMIYIKIEFRLTDNTLQHHYEVV
jgi:hypothetical protein